LIGAEQNVFCQQGFGHRLIRDAAASIEQENDPANDRDALKAMERTEHGVVFLKMPYFISSSKEKRLEVEAFLRDH
jgi:hypothetical protein